MSDADRGKEEEKESLSRLVHSPILHHWSRGSMVFPSARLSLTEFCCWSSACCAFPSLGHCFLMICDLWFMIHHLWDSWFRCSCIKCMWAVRLIYIGHMTAGKTRMNALMNFRLSCECEFWGCCSVVIWFVADEPKGCKFTAYKRWFLKTIPIVSFIPDCFR